LQATYLGGSGTDEALALAIHPTSGDVYVAGDTGSTNFPGTTGGAQAANGGGLDAFVARLTVGLVAVEPTPTDTPTSTPTNTPALPVNIPTTSEGGCWLSDCSWPPSAISCCGVFPPAAPLELLAQVNKWKWVGL